MAFRERERKGGRDSLHGPTSMPAAAAAWNQHLSDCQAWASKIRTLFPVVAAALVAAAAALVEAAVALAAASVVAAAQPVAAAVAEASAAAEAVAIDAPPTAASISSAVASWGQSLFSKRLLMMIIERKKRTRWCTHLNQEVLVKDTVRVIARVTLARGIVDITRGKRAGEKGVLGIATDSSDYDQSRSLIVSNV